MFFIARIVAAMLTGFCGSYSTTTTASSNELDIWYTKGNEVDGVVTIAAQVHKIAATSTQHELPAPALATAGQLVHEHVDRAWEHAADRDVDAIAGAVTPPCRVDRSETGLRPALERSNSHRRRGGLRYEHPAGEAGVRRQ